MESSALFFHTSIDSTQKKKRLLTGTFVASIGALCLLLPVIYPSLSLALFIAGIAFIATGLIPYKKITRLENFPITLRCTADSISLRQGASSLVIRYAHITGIFYDIKKRSLILELRYILTPEPLKNAPWKRYYSLKTLRLTLPQFTKEAFEALKEISSN